MLESARSTCRGTDPRLALWLLAMTFLLSQTALAQAIDSRQVLSAMESEARLPADRERDVRSKPQSVIPLLNIEPGDRVIDIFGSGGYYSDLLARVLGEEGRAILHNNQGFQQWGSNVLQDRFENGLPRNVVMLNRSGINLDLPPRSLDAALIVMALHDLYVIPKRYDGEKYVPVGPPANVEYFYEQLLTALKPGGRFVVVDHAGEPDMDVEATTDLHRIGEDYLRSDIEANGFSFVSAESSLRNREDDRTRIVFDEDLQGRTDRFILVFEKPRLP